jgi:crossover junction endodeoxyribonuclease RusA
MNDYEFILPFPVSANAVWRGAGRYVYLSGRSKKFRTEVLEHMASIGLYREFLDEPLIVTLVLNPPSKREYDVDNFFKSTFDALTYCGFWTDDKLVIECRAIKGQVTKKGNVMVRVKKNTLPK